MGDGGPSATSMKQGGRAHEQKRCRVIIEVECTLPAMPRWCSRAASLLQHLPTPSSNPQDAVSEIGQLSTTRLLSAFKKASGPHWYHRWDAAGALSPCVRPSGRALVTPDGSDEIAMEAPSSALQPHQVSVITCGLADSTSGTVARSHSSLA